MQLTNIILASAFISTVAVAAPTPFESQADLVVRGSFFRTGSAKSGFAKFDSAKSGLAKPGSAKSGATKPGSTKSSPSKIDSSKTDPSSTASSSVLPTIIGDPDKGPADSTRSKTANTAGTANGTPFECTGQNLHVCRNMCYSALCQPNIATGIHLQGTGISTRALRPGPAGPNRLAAIGSRLLQTNIDLMREAGVDVPFNHGNGIITLTNFNGVAECVALRDQNRAICGSSKKFAHLNKAGPGDGGIWETAAKFLGLSN